MFNRKATQIMQFLEYQSMLNSTKPHKRFSEIEKINNETDKTHQLPGSVRVLSFRLIVMLIIGFAKAKRRAQKEMKLANHGNQVANHVYRSCA